MLVSQPPALTLSRPPPWCQFLSHPSPGTLLPRAGSTAPQGAGEPRPETREHSFLSSIVFSPRTHQHPGPLQKNLEVSRGPRKGATVAEAGVLGFKTCTPAGCWDHVLRLRKVTAAPLQRRAAGDGAGNAAAPRWRQGRVLRGRTGLGAEWRELSGACLIWGCVVSFCFICLFVISYLASQDGGSEGERKGWRRGLCANHTPS